MILLTWISAFLIGAALARSSAKERQSPEYQHTFQLPLIIPPVKEPLSTYTNPQNGVPIDFYQLDISESKHTFYPDLENATVVGFDGTFMGPTFRVQKGRETVVRLVNRSNRKTNLHLHGSFSKLWHLG
jgi:bilirubin oxidase